MDNATGVVGTQGSKQTFGVDQISTNDVDGAKIVFHLVLLSGTELQQLQIGFCQIEIEMPASLASSGTGVDLILL
jgi:hypothetical protein